MGGHDLLKKCIAVAAAFCFLLPLASCGQNDQKNISSGPEEVTPAAEESTVSTEAEGTETEEEITSATEEPPSSEESTEESGALVPEEEETPVYLFFGRPMDEARWALNRKTLEAAGSGLCDLTSYETPTRGEVLQLIEAYKMPDAVLFDDVPAEEEEADPVREALDENRNTGLLQENADAPADIRYAILTDNADVRSFPSSVKGWDRKGANALDLFQETRLSLGEGVILLHSSSDGEWLFVQAQNYAGWIPAACAAFCTEEEFLNYLTRSSFVVTLEPELEFREKELRLATILPYSDQTQHYYFIDFPERDPESGNLRIIRRSLKKSDSISDGYLDPGFDSLMALIPDFTGTAYGWGDSDNLYDCSSTLGLLYRAQGIYLPRNTSQMKWIGQDTADVGAWTDEEKTAYFEDRPGALLVMNGHVMLYLGKEGEEHLVFHETTGYNTSEGNYQDLHQAVIIPLEQLYDSAGNSFTGRISYIADPLEGGLR